MPACPRRSTRKASDWAEVIIAAAGVAGITSVLLVMMLSALRVFLAMARDGLVPPSSFRRRPSPLPNTLEEHHCHRLFCVGSSTGFLPIDALLHLTNIGTLFAFVIVCGAVLIMRRTDPDGRAPLPLSVRARRADPGHRELPAADVVAARGELVSADRLARPWTGDLLYLRQCTTAFSARNFAAKSPRTASAPAGMLKDSIKNTDDRIKAPWIIPPNSRPRHRITITSAFSSVWACSTPPCSSWAP